MLKLIKLEMKKTKVRYVKGVLISNLVIMALLAITIFGAIGEGNLEFTRYTFVFSMVDSMIRATFIIFASVLLAKLIIEEYKNNTITILFMYPINRKKLIMAKLIIVASFTFVTTVLSNIFIDSALCIINNFYNFTTDKITVSLIINSFRNIFISGLLSAGISLIPLYFGMKKKSVPTTIISAIIIVSIVCSNGNGISLNSIIAVPITLALIGVFIAYLSIKNIEHVDINK